MKKIGLLITPVMAISFLLSCGGGKTNVTYKVTVDEAKCDHLSFLTVDNKSLNGTDAIANEDFKFKIRVNNNSNYEYITPTMIDIVINNMDPLLDGYTISNINETEANVTINASKIVGDIKLSGEAGIKNGYRYKVPYHYGLEEIANGIHVNSDGDLLLNFVPISKDIVNDTYAYPDAENIYIQFDNVPSTTNPIQWVSPAETFGTIGEYCSYNASTGELTIKSNHIKSNITIVARAKDYPLLDKLSWTEISKISFSGAAEYIFYLGEEKTVKVNNLDQSVRIIGFNQDKDENDKSIGVTFEFTSLISDENGYSLATYWNDTSEASKVSNHNYKDSTIRACLNGTFVDPSQGSTKQIHWFQYFGTDEDTGRNRLFSEDYSGKSVLSMLPDDLKAQIKTTKKIVNIWNSDKKTEAKWEEQSFNDKLFLLTPKEMGLEAAESSVTTYKYYATHTETVDEIRIKKQIKGSEGARTSLLDGVESGEYKDGTKNSHAGYHYKNENIGYNGGRWWLRSPNTDMTLYVGTAWYVNPDGGTVCANYHPNSSALGIAPAFCI